MSEIDSCLRPKKCQLNSSSVPDGSSMLMQDDINNDKGEPSQKRMRFSPEALIEEIIRLENTEIKTGLAHCTDVIIYLDGQEVDLLNISPDIVSNLLKNESTNETEKENILHPNLRKSIEKRLSSDNTEFLNYLAQSIIHEILGSNYQASPYKFCVYQENDFRFPCPNTEEKDLSHFLILVCPTNCQGGKINFPAYSQKFCGEINKNLAYALFENKTQYEVLKVTKGLRVLVTYRIFKRNLKIERNDLLVSDTGRLQEMLEDIREENVLIPITEGNITQEICEKAGIHFELVFSQFETPYDVYADILTTEAASTDRCEIYLDFEQLLYDSTKYEVGTFINLPEPKLVIETYDTVRKRGSSMCSTGEVEYYSFLLINPTNGEKQ